MEKNKWELAKKNGVEEKYRSDEISKNIENKGYSLNDQIALLMDRDSKPEKFKAYQSQIRATAKAEVDAEIAAFESAEGGTT